MIGPRQASTEHKSDFHPWFRTGQIHPCENTAQRKMDEYLITYPNIVCLHFKCNTWLYGSILGVQQSKAAQLFNPQRCKKLATSSFMELSAHIMEWTIPHTLILLPHIPRKIPVSLH